MDWLIAPDANKFPVTVVMGGVSQPLVNVLNPFAKLVSKGDTVYFAPGTYHLPAQWGTEFSLASWAPDLTTQLGTLQGVATTFATIQDGIAGTPDAPITFEGILDADGNMPTIDGRGYFRSCGFRVNGSHLTFRNFRIIGCHAGFQMTGSTGAKQGIRIENCEVGEYGTATKRVTVFYQDPNNSAVTSLTPNVLAKPPIDGDSSDNYPTGVHCDMFTRDLTVTNCYFHDLGSTETADLAAISDPDLSNDWISHYFGHGHALYLMGVGNVVQNCRFERIAQGYCIKFDQHYALRDALGLPVPVPSQLSATPFFPWATHWVVGCQFTGATAPPIGERDGARGYVMPYASDNPDDIPTPDGLLHKTDASIMIFDCDFYMDRADFAAIQLPTGGGWPQTYAKFALLCCRLYGGTVEKNLNWTPSAAGPMTNAATAAMPQEGWSFQDAHWTFSPKLVQIDKGMTDGGPILGLNQSSKENWSRRVYRLPDFKSPGITDAIAAVQKQWIAVAEWESAFGPTDIYIYSSDKRACQPHSYGTPYPSPIADGKNNNWAGWFYCNLDTGKIGNRWELAPLPECFDNVPDHNDFFIFLACERLPLQAWALKPWSLPVA